MSQVNLRKARNHLAFAGVGGTVLAQQGLRKRSLGQQAFLRAFLIQVAVSGEEEGEAQEEGGKLSRMDFCY